MNLGLGVKACTFYSHTGRPSIDPELVIRMLLVSYCYSIRSERRLCDRVNYNLVYRWFCNLGLEDCEALDEIFRQMSNNASAEPLKKER